MARGDDTNQCFHAQLPWPTDSISTHVPQRRVPLAIFSPFFLHTASLQPALLLGETSGESEMD